MAYEAVGFDPSSHTLAPAVKAYLDSLYQKTASIAFQATLIGTAYTPGTGTLYHDVGTVVVTTASTGAVAFAYPRTYSGIMYMDQVLGDRNDSTSHIQPILGNMTLSSGFNGYAVNNAGGAAAGLTIRVNYEVWGWV